MNDAKLYSSASTLQARDAKEVLDKYRDLMTWEEDCDVLDVGCGSGDVTTALLIPALKRWNTVTGVDISPSMVEFAAAKHQQPNLQFHCMDIEDKNVQPRSVFPGGFDKIFSFFCLHWIRDQRQAVTNLFELLKPGAELLVIFLAQISVFTIYEKMAIDSPWSKYLTDATNFISPYQHSEHPEDELADHLRKSGFTDKFSCKSISKEFTYPTMDGFKSAMQAVNPFLDRIPKYQQESFMNDYMDEFRCMGAVSSDGTVTLKYQMFEVFAKKS